MMIRLLGSKLSFTGNGGFSYCTGGIAVSHFRNEQSGNDFICSLCKQKLFREAFDAFDLLVKDTNFNVYPSTYARLINSCSSLRFLNRGKKVHGHIVSSNYGNDLILQNHVLNMYGKCGSLSDARRVFDGMTERNVVSWTEIIAGYSQNGEEIEAMKLYCQMQREGFVPNHYTFGNIIKASSGFDELELGRQLHANVIKSELGSHLIPQNALISMYVKFGQIHEAEDVFAHIQSKDLTSWSSIIGGFSKLGYEMDALCYFKNMLSQGTTYHPNEFIFGSVFSACGSVMQAEYGRQVHGMSMKFGLGRDTYAGCSLADMYAKCGFLDSMEAAFFQIKDPDLVAWNAVIAGFAYGGDPSKAINFFSKMRNLGFGPDNITIRSLLCGFTSAVYLFQVKQVHSYVYKTGFDSNVSVSNTLLSMYGNCSDIYSAYRMFNEIGNSADQVSWNAILNVCMQHSQAEQAFSLFKLMLFSHNKPDHATLLSMLGVCGKATSLEMTDQFFCLSLKSGMEQDTSVMNGLIDTYVKCGSLGDAQKLFDCIKDPDVFSWSCLIVGYAQFGHGEEALKLFWKMRNLGIKPNQVTFVGVLTACSHVGLTEEGWKLFSTMEMEHGIIPTREHCSCVIDLLARSGRINEAEDFMNQMVFDPDVVMWKSLLSACKIHNNIEVGERAAQNILKIDPCNSSAYVLLSSIYASKGRKKDFAALRILMKRKGVSKVPGQSWIEIKNKIHMFSAGDGCHPEISKIYIMLEELLLQMLDAGYIPSQR